MHTPDITKQHPPKLALTREEAGEAFYTEHTECKPRIVLSKKEQPRSEQTTLRDRRERWRRTALVEDDGHFQAYYLKAPFHDLVADLLFPAAMEGRYLGGGHFLISDYSQLEPWISQIT